ncbi:hypothetical protein Acor_18350 [Acrocarpospora corrugata]|uniref:Uncharacterized protein n=1 Tax=Acrocarpospora corrugata TaxID=35763 RepID=A0A5M3VVS3_9ACTN|nr:hypothetical protein [Acrocarpospora corrugata]GER99771.1 hypothetical protein Acor_18350 [Acrocarpospora corrugata]
MILAGAEATAGVNLSASLSVEIGNTIEVPTPPKKTANASYGVWRKKTSGNYVQIFSNCSEKVRSSVTAWAPWKIGWRTWES